MPHTMSTTFGDIMPATRTRLFDEDIDDRICGWVGDRVFKALQEVCSKPRFDASFMKEEDALTKTLYKKDENGLLIFPSVPNLYLSPIHSYLGDQTSMFHKEPSDDHARFVAGRLIENGKKIGIEPKIAGLIGTWHDVGKKYTAHTGPNGVSFFGHAQLSAYIALHWLKQVNTLSAEEKKAIVAAIYGHDIVKLGGYTAKRKYHDWLSTLSNKVNRMNTRFCEALVQADASMELIADDHVEFTVVEFCPEREEKLYEYTRVVMDKTDYNATMATGEASMRLFPPAPVVAA